MKKILIILFLLFIPFISINALELPETSSSKVLIYDLTEEKLLHEKSVDEITSIASITKIMTVYTAVKEGNLDQSITITNQMLWGIPWDLRLTGLKVGETYTLREVCYAAMIDSGGDDTNVIAYAVSGSLDAFINKMNENAQNIGMTNTHYVNVHGLDAEGHYSTARDVFLLLKEALKNEDFKDIYYKAEYKLNDDITVKRWYKSMLKQNDINPNNLLGGKTGYTDDAGTCYAGLYKSDGHEFIIIILNAAGTNDDHNNILDLIELMKFVDNEYNYYPIIKKGDLIGTIDIFLGKENQYQVHAPEDVMLFLPSDYNTEKVHYYSHYTNTIIYGSKKGKILGSVDFYFGNDLISSSSIILDKDIEGDYAKIIDYYTNDIILFVSLFILVVLLLAIRYFKPIKHKNKKEL